MKKIFIVLLFVLFFSVGIFKGNAFADGEKYVRVIYTTINVFDSANAGGGANVVATAKYGDKLELFQNGVVDGEDSLQYYIVVLSGGNVYVLASQVTPDEISSPQKELDTNAVLSSDSQIYKKNGDEFFETGEELKADTKIKVLDGLDYSKVYTRIQCQKEDGEIVVCYIKTNAIKKSGISRATIGAICIIVATVSIVLVSFGIKARLKKKIRQR